MHFNIDHRLDIVVRWAHYSTNVRVSPKRVYTTTNPNLVPPHVLRPFHMLAGGPKETEPNAEQVWRP